MKTFVFFLVLLVASYSSAQERNLINRVDLQSAEQASRIEHRVYSRVCLDSKVAVPASAETKTFSIMLDESTVDLKKFSFGYYGSIIGVITNYTTDTVRLIFNREQTRETDEVAGWSTSVCFGDICHTASVSSVPPENAFKLPPSGQAEFRLNVTSLVKNDDSILVHILVSAVGSTAEDTVGLWMSAIAKDPASVSEDQATRRSRIRAVYPSPLIIGNQINVRIDAARDLGYRYSIFDQFAREVAFGTSQRKLAAGDNTIGINSLEGLNSGSYVLKVSFSDGSTDAYPFAIVR